MKNLLVIMGLFGIAVLLAACSSSPSNTFTISGELVTIEPDLSEAEKTETTSTGEGEESSEALSETNTEPPVDWSTATIVVSTTVTAEDGEAVETELATANFVDGKFSITGEIEGPTGVKIAAHAGKDEELATLALLKPGGEVAIVLVDDMQEYPTDGIYLLGESNSSQDAAQKLTVRGDFGKELHLGLVSVSGRQLVDGSMQFFSLGYVLLSDGKFTIQADVEEAQVVNFYLSTPHSTDDYVFVSSKFIAEPNANYEVSLRGEDYLFVTSGEGKHAEVVESWEQSIEYQEKFDAYETAFAAYEAEQEALKAAAESTDLTSLKEGEPTEAEESVGVEEDADAEIDIAHADETTSESELGEDKSLASKIEPAQDCEHVVIDQTHQTMADMFFSDEPREGEPEHATLRRELSQMKDVAMRKILDESDDPINVLLAMELGAIDMYGDDGQDALRVYDSLAEQLDPDIVAQRITPTRDAIVVRIERNENDRTLLQGQKVPAFTLANADGVEMALYDILAEKEVTLIDFWASWCGPCIATFPDLKRLYSAYSDDGFEIVGVSIDDNYDDWNAASIEHEIPWIDLGELKDWEGPVAVSYGVGFIPKAYLVDSMGCVLKKHVHTEMLEEALVQRFGEVPDASESAPNAETAAYHPGSDVMGG